MMPDRSRPPPASVTTAPPGSIPGPAAHETPAAPPAPRRGTSRNLFKSHLTRRPTSGATMSNAGAAAHHPSSSSNNSAETLRLPDVGIHSDGASPELVARDAHGEIEILGNLPAPGVLDDDDEGVMHDQEERKKERQRLADAVRQHQMNHSAILDQPEEVLDAIRRSLKAKVAALEEDQWMYEAGDRTMRR